MNEEGKHTEEGEYDPDGRYHDKGIMATQGVFGFPTHQQKQEGTAKSNQHGHQESQCVVFLIIEGHTQAPDHEEGLNEQQ